MFRKIKVPLVFQMEAVECGAAALGMVLGYHGLWVPLEELREKCSVTRDGVSAASIVKASDFYGLTAKAYRKEIHELSELSFPQIIFWNFDHFLVLESINDKKACVCDPAFGRKTIDIDEFDKGFTGITIEFEESDYFSKGGHRENVISSLIGRVSGSWVDMQFVVMLSVLTIIPGLTIPAMSRIFVDYYLIDKHETWLWPLLIGLSAAGFVLATLSYLQDSFLLKFRNKFSLIYSSKFFWRIMRLDILFFDHRFTGDLGNRLMLNDQVANQISGPLASSFLHLSTVFVYLTVLFQYDVTLTLIGLVGILTNILIVRLFSKGLSDSSKKVLMDRSKVSSVALHGLSMFENFKATAAENLLFTKVLGLHAKAISGEQKLGSIRNIYQGLSEFILNINMLMVLVLGAVNVMQGSITLGMFIGFQALMIYLQKPVRNLVMLSGSMQELAGGLSRIDDVLQNPHFSDESIPGADDTSTQKITGQLNVQNVVYRFSGNSDAIINGANLIISPGQWIGISGNSGSGKTTFVRLVAGLYSPSEGEILYDGLPQAQLDKLVFRHGVSFVQNSPRMFQGTLRENLTLWDELVEEQDIVAACKTACIHDAIHARSGAYDTKVEFNGSNFSGGEIQRIAIARALIRKPKILIMDEATSALDVQTEKELIFNLKQLPLTILFVSHKSSVLNFCHQIYDLADGQLLPREIKSEDDI